MIVRRIEQLPDLRVATSELFTEMYAAAVALNDPRAAEVAQRKRERQAAIHAAVKSVAELPPEMRSPIESALQHVERHADADRPGDDFNARASWPEVLVPAGWTDCGNDNWRRPGGSGTTASTKFGALVIYSPNAAPLEVTGPGQPAYSKFGAYTLLYHDGDFKAASKALRELGYGKKRPKRNSRSKRSKKQGGGTRSADAAAVAAELDQTDSGNAIRLVRRATGNLRHCRAWKKWLHWTGKVWHTDTTGWAQALTKQVAEQLIEEGLGIQHKDDGALLSWGQTSASEPRRRAMLTLAECEPGMSVDPRELNTHPCLLNCSNGTLELKTQTLRPHSREDLLTKLVPTPYQPDAAAPVWDRFLKRVIPDEEDRKFLQGAVGCSLSGAQEKHVVYFLVGEGENGKTTFLNAIKNVVGSDYAIQVAPDVLLRKSHRGHPTELADLFGVRIAICAETGQQAELDEELVKQLTGGDFIRARRMREDFWEFPPTHHIWVATNHRPSIQGTDHAIWRRVVVVPFEEKILASEKDEKLPEKLQEEAAGILAWAVRGYKAAQEDGLRVPDKLIQIVARYREDMDILSQFLEACCDVGDAAMRIRTTDLYVLYAAWCKTHGERSLSQHLLRPEMKRRKFESRKSHGVMCYLGLQLRREVESDQFGEAGETLTYYRL